MMSLTEKEKLGKLALWKMSYISDTSSLRKQQNIQLEIHVRMWGARGQDRKLAGKEGVARQDISPEPHPFI